MKKLHGFILFVILCLAFPFVADALETDTHKAINKYIARNTLNGFSLDSYLKNQLGFANGIEEEFKSTETKKAWDWVQFGGEFEDIPAWYLQYIRSLNHFHNPITEEGFKGNCLQSSLCVSSTVWALMPLGTQSSLTGNYSWYDVRAYYYTALTGKDYSGNIIAADKTQRDAYFAQTFRGLGQLMHLIQDASVPSHTRNDFHFIKNYEDYAKSFVERFGVSTPNNADFYNGTISAITSFIDTNQYTGSNPVDVIGNTIGLSEYTNANFFSEDTIFSFSFPYPSWSNVVEYPQDMGNGKKRTYLKKLGQGEVVGDKTGYGEHIEHLAAGRWFYKYLPEFIKGSGLTLDDNVYNNYASLLLPRAVGYSAGFLNYFFRGNFKITNASYTSTSVTMQIKNKTYINPSEPANSAIETMGPGSLMVSYSYKDSQKNTIYGLSSSVNVDNVPSGCNSYLNITFPLNGSIPSDASDVSFILIYRGVLGSESDAIAAKKAPIVGSTRIAYYHQPGGFGSGNNPSYIYSIDPDGQNITQITNDSYGYTGDFSPALSPDGTKLAFSATDGYKRDIIVVDLTSTNAYPGNIIRILDSTPSGSSYSYDESSPSWSPDGTEITATRWQGSSTDREIIIFNVDTGEWRQITSSAVVEQIGKLEWSPTESRIVYSATTSESGSSRDDIFVINTDGSNKINLTNDNYADTSPSWSPDGAQILFSSKRDGGSIYDLWVMDADGKNPRHITDYTQSIYSSAWSPDGEQIVFSIGTGYSDLYIIDSDGTCPYALTNDNYYSYTALNGSPSWGRK
ncbi:MAG: hypothetical protein A3G39_07010 [Deltaproteobacteria bacterium RIFCSPLOWO2_12_FULL_43_16]|nr:MAG: hypothetical protein A2Z89_01160 [Deltaproteobacteria bacterium GWA2_43_19]OGQ12753.1 MAG: hypothetical protein A3D30_05920 [Deltaproteobacteria bacterium RIFCSPHIGHO2_02_FULL_43_33]OGQ60784.1 MAG: hypothetical protein A3G39_07010 [Deltaproteobacteria bacterium RIFCSPLOWO2_12_FULL_43_16]